MSADRKGSKTFGKPGNSSLNDMVDFGPDTVVTGPQPSGDFMERIKQIVKKLQEINKRIDDLGSR